MSKHLDKTEKILKYGIKISKKYSRCKYFRINISKSGIGYSYGIPGARITHSADGRVSSTVGIPGTGLSYTNTIKKASSKTNSHVVSSSTVQANRGISSSVLTENVDIKNLQTVEMSKLFKTIRKARRVNKFGIFLLIVGLLYILLSMQPDITKNEIAVTFVGIFFALVGVAVMILAHTILRAYLDYSLDDEESNVNYNLRLTAWRTFLSSSAKWQIITSASVYNRKINAGASSIVNRVKISTKKTPFYIKTKSDVITLKLNRERIIIIPDKMIVVKGSKFGAIDYSDLKILTYTGRFIEDSFVPKDVQIINYTWQYVNKNGSPDRRYANNRQIPVCLYGHVDMSTYSGFNINLLCSNSKNIDLFTKLTNNAIY